MQFQLLFYVVLNVEVCNNFTYPIMQVQRKSNENQVKNTSTIGLIERLEKQIVCNSVQTTDFGTDITEFGIKI